jgi:hypothetical protein
VSPQPEPAQSPDCQEEQQLLNAYSQAAHAFSVAVEALSTARNKAPRKDYERMRRMSEQARMNA